jgi:hypothetical protein
MKKFLGKPVIDVNKSDFYPETPYYEDMRVVFLAHFFEKRKEEVEVESQMHGLFKYYYRKTGMVRRLLAIFLFLLMVFKKPAWCSALGDTISADCTQGADGKVYFTFTPFFVASSQVTILSFGIMYFLIGFQTLKIHFSKAIVRNELIKFYLLLTLFVAGLLVSILESLGAFARTEITTLFGLLFAFFYFKLVIKAMRYFLRMISYSWEVLLLWFLNVFIFALIARLAFEDVDIGSPSFFQGYSFASFADSLSSIFALISLQSFPDILVDAHAKNPISIILFIPFLVFSSILIGASIIGNYYFHFKMCYIENLNEQYARHPEFRAKVVPLLKEKFLNPLQAKGAMNQLAFQLKREQQTGQIIPLVDEGRKATLFKLKRAVKKITILKNFNLKTPQNSFRALYLRLRASFAYKVVDFVVSVYAVALPLISLSKGNGLTIADNVQVSELIGTLFLIDFVVFAKFNVKDNFWSTLRVVELISSLGMVIFSHITYLFPLDFRTDILIGSTFFFRAWAFASLLKLFRIHKIFLNSIDYKVIIKTLQHILPIISEFLVIYLFLVVFFSGISFVMLGGTYTEGLRPIFAELTGRDLETVYAFNDLLGSFVAISFFNLGGEFNDIGLPAVIAFQRGGSSQTTNVLLTIFFYIYSIISELMIVNLIIGLTMDFLMAYGDNNALLIKTNRAFTSNTNIIDRVLGLKTLENYGLDDPAADEPKDQDPAHAELSMELSKDFESVEY